MRRLKSRCLEVASLVFFVNSSEFISVNYGTCLYHYLLYKSIAYSVSILNKNTKLRALNLSITPPLRSAGR